MELKTSYQYTYFIYPYAIKEENYKKYLSNLMVNKKYKIKFFDTFKNIELYEYFVPTVKEKLFQNFSYDKEKVNKFNKLNLNKQIKILQNESCVIFEYILENEIQGKVEEQDGIFFTVPKIELICFNTGICFLTIKTSLLGTNKFEDILNFNYKFQNINLENKNIKKLDNIKIQTNAFSNMNKISEILEQITGQKLENRKIDIEENIFSIYTYACLEASFWNKEEDFESIKNEFIKLSEVKTSDSNINVNYDKLDILSDSSYLKVRISNKCVSAICSTADTHNYTKFPEIYENEYLYTYIIALHQKYYLKKLNIEIKKKPENTIKEFINFYSNIFISEITTDSLGQKFYIKCKQKFNIDEIFNELKNQYEIFYKKIKIDENNKANLILTILLGVGILIGTVNIISWLL